MYAKDQNEHLRRLGYAIRTETYAISCVRSGDPGGLKTGTPFLIQGLEYAISSQSRTAAQKCVGALS
ncbi:hypothetical protein TNCV_1430111 [Trichonephila clavipes]|nr:hypothetical protein TNCV_1430111 [Trichonephila clavipes]